MRDLIGTHDILFITLDTLRYDAACDALKRGLTPNLGTYLPHYGWEERHSPASFTYAAHHAFFAGFLPTPASPGKHSRLFAAKFSGSETTSPETYIFDAPDIVTALTNQGYHTICIGGVGFFNRRSRLGSVLPELFAESHWLPDFGVTDPASTANQVSTALDRLRQFPLQKRIFLFLNVSALHQPNYMYLSGATEDSYETHLAALAYVDRQLPRLFYFMASRAPTFVIICSDHGTAYGEDGYWGHRIGHPTVWTVPYAQFNLRVTL